MSLKLVDDAKGAWRWISMRCMTIAGAVQGAWMFLTDDMKASIPTNIVQWVTGGLLVLGIAGRLVKQS